MTTLWEHERDGTRYSVRAAGGSIRLYSNGVFHSQWNPERPFAGGVWDCLGLPVLYRPTGATRRVLLLGVGGGAVIRQLEWLVPEASVTGVEIDPVHVQVARRWFGVLDRRASSRESDPAANGGGGERGDGTGSAADAGVDDVTGDGPDHETDEGMGERADGVGATLVEGDAIAWLRAHAGEPFDLIVDDLFGHDEGEPVRARPLTPDWVALLRASVVDGGLVVVNCADGRELKTAAPAFADEGFRYARRWSQSGYENAIGVFSSAPLVPREWSRRLETTALSAPMQRRARAIVRRPLRV